jgi:hypothetical protein
MYKGNAGYVCLFIGIFHTCETTERISIKLYCCKCSFGSYEFSVNTCFTEIKVLFLRYAHVQQCIVYCTCPRSGKLHHRN